MFDELMSYGLVGGAAIIIFIGIIIVFMVIWSMRIIRVLFSLVVIACLIFGLKYYTSDEDKSELEKTKLTVEKTAQDVTEKVKKTIGTEKNIYDKATDYLSEKGIGLMDTAKEKTKEVLIEIEKNKENESSVKK